MKHKIFLLIGIILTIVMVLFVLYAFQHPEMSFRCDRTITYIFYILYLIITIIMYVLYFKK